jgi:dihydroorotate dehydrogenase (fumarate)
MLLAGANSVQIVSTLYRNKASHLTKMLETIESWMDFKGYKTLDEFRGKLSLKNIENKYAYQRAQYVDILMGADEILNRYPMT